MAAATGKPQFAAAYKNKPSKQECLAELVFDLKFDEASEAGPINCTLMAEAVVALVKFLLYQRGQTPDMFDSMAASIGSHVLVEATTTLAGVRRRQEDMKIVAFVEAFTETFAHLGRLLKDEKRTRIRRVALIFGSTPITPKEVHCIEIVGHRSTIRRPSAAAASASSRHIQSMFKSLFSASRDADFPKCSSGTNVIVMVEASATSNMTWFVPKNYSPLPATCRATRRGRQFTYRLSSTFESNSDGPPTPRIISSGSHVEESLQGRPFTVYESPVPTTTPPSIPVQHAPIDLLENGVETPFSVLHETFLWFQMPTLVRGLNLRS